MQVTTRTGIVYTMDTATSDARTVASPDGDVVTLGRDGFTSANGLQVRFVRDPAGRITSIIDPAGESIAYGYDALGRLDSFTAADGRVESYEYDGETSELSRVLDGDGNVLSSTRFDLGSGRLSEVVDANGYVTQTTVDLVNLTESVTDPLGRTIRTKYDYEGNPVQFSAGDGGVSYFEYDASGNVEQIIDPLGRVTELTYANGDQLISLSDELRSTWRFSYNDDGSLRSQTDPLGRTSLNQADRNRIYPTLINGAFVYTADAASSYRELTPDGDQRTASSIRARLTRVTTETAVDFDGSRTVTVKTPTFTLDPQSGNTVYTVVAVSSRTAPGATGVTETSTEVYDERDNMLSRVDDTGTTTYTYDAAGRQTSITVNGRTSTLSYDGQGRLVTQTDSYGLTTKRTYDPAGNLIAEILPDDTPATDDDNPRRTFAYDAAGQRTIETDEFGSVLSFTNDAAGRVTARTTQAIDQLAVTTATTYDLAGQVLTSTDGYGRTASYTYDAAGRQIHQVNFDGRIVETVYDAAGQTIAQTDPYVLGEDVEGFVYTFDAAGRIATTRRYANLNIQITGTSDRDRRSVLEPVTSDVVWTESSVYAQGRLLSQTDREATVTTYTYDINERLVSTRDSRGNETTYGYDGAGNRNSVTDADGNVTLSIYDDRERVIRTQTNRGVIRDTVYDAEGRAVLRTDPHVAGQTVYATRTDYDELGRLIGSAYLEGVDVQIVSNRSIVADPGTVLWTTTTVYDSLSRVSRMIAADGQVTDYEYDRFGRRIAEISGVIAMGGVLQRHRTETVYNGSGQATRQVSGIAVIVPANWQSLAWPSSSDRYSALGITIDRSTAVGTDHAYDQYGNLVQTTFADGTNISFTYDEEGQKLTETNQLGQTRTFMYDDDGQLTGVTLPAVGGVAPTYQYGYDDDDNQTSLIDPLGRTTRFTFDTQGRQTSRTLPLGFGADGIASASELSTLDSEPSTRPYTETFQYDDRNRPSLHVSFEGVVTQTVYDQNGNVGEKRFFENSVVYNDGTGVPGEVWAYSYDPRDRQTGVNQIIGGVISRSESMVYDDRGRMTQHVAQEGVVTYAYDDLGRQISVAVHTDDANVSDRITRYTYDSLGRLATVTENDLSPADNDHVHRYGYDLQGRLDIEQAANNVVTDYEYDQLGRLDTLTHYQTDGSAADIADLSNNPVVASFDYTVREDGRRTGLTETFSLDPDGDGNFETFTATKSYDYDVAGRLVDEALDHWDATLDFHATYAFDAVGNRVSKSTDQGNDGTIDEIISSLFDVNDRLLTSTTRDGDDIVTNTTEYGYRATQQATETDSVNSVSSVVKTFTYDLQGRQETVRITASDSITRSTYDYDSTGIRISAFQEIDTNADGTFDDISKVEFVLDHDNHTGYEQVLRETKLDADGKITRTIDYTFGLDELSQTVTEFNADGSTASSRTDFFLHDGHGDVRALAGAAGAIATILGVQQQFTFDAYGNLLNLAANQAATSTLYSGERFDVLTGQQYLRARYYDPNSGTFNRLDPFFGNSQDPQSFHKYAYVHGDPVQGIDPTGQFFDVVFPAEVYLEGLSAAADATLLGFDPVAGFLYGMSTAIFASVSPDAIAVSIVTAGAYGAVRALRRVTSHYRDVFLAFKKNNVYQIPTRYPGGTITIKSFQPSHRVLAEKRLLTRGEELAEASKPSLRGQLGERHLYSNPGHHQPFGGDNPYRPGSTVLPSIHVNLFNAAVPYRNEKDRGKITYFAKDSDGNYHRFQADGNNIEFHWNGQTNGRDRYGNLTDDRIKIPHEIKQQLDATP